MNDSEHRQALPAGHELRGYRLLRVLGVGGFGVTYLAEHATLGHRVAIKEYLPNEFAVRDGATVHPKSAADREDFEWGLERFLEEGRTLARFEHRNLVRVRDYFEANNTACIVMDYEDGESLDRLLARHGTLSEDQLRRVLLPIVDGLREVHGEGILHRDVKPSNVYVRRADESPVLLDFGAARHALGRKSRSMTAVVTAGYSPPEQYESDGEQGPWTDVYALAALCYRAIAGETPAEAPSRQRRLLSGEADPLPRLAESDVSGYSKGFLEAVDRGLAVLGTERPQTLDEFKNALNGATATAKAEPAPASSRRPKRRAKPMRVLAWVGAAAAAAAVAALAVLFAPRLVNPGQATLTVRTEPPGATVRVDGRDRGETPLETAVAAGVAHEVALEHPFHETIRLRTEPLADGQTLRIERTLTRAAGALRIVTQPPGAWAERDGERLADATPTTVRDLPAGPLTLVLGATEHRPVEARVEVPKDGIATLERVLEPIPHGTLTLELDPPDAQATLPDIGPSYRPGMRLPEGPHRVVVSRAGYRTVERTVAVSGDTRARVELEASRQPFTVLPTPPSATVRVEGQAAYRAGMELPAGEYRVEVSAPGYKTRAVAVRHEAGEPTSRRIELERDAPGVGETFRDPLRSGGEGPLMAVVPSGSFRMGSPSYEEGRNEDEGPVHRVTIGGPLAIGVHEVTRGQFERFAEATGHSDGGSCWTHEDGKWENRSERGWLDPGFRQSSSHPVVCVSWRDARAYAEWLSRETGEAYRLPSASEWEYAARAGTETARYWGDGEDGQCRHANGADMSTDFSWRTTCEDGYRRTSPAGRFQANGWGLHDMLGNVWEWTEDCWNGSYRGAPADGSAWTSGDCSRRVLRGGSWDYDPGVLRAADRSWLTSGFRDYSSGFRVVRTLAP